MFSFHLQASVDSSAFVCVWVRVCACVYVYMTCMPSAEKIDVNMKKVVIGEKNVAVAVIYYTVLRRTKIFIEQEGRGESLLEAILPTSVVLKSSLQPCNINIGYIHTHAFTS